MNPSTVVIRFETVAEQPAWPVMRIVGFVKGRELLQLFDSADLDANPRASKAGAVVDDILESIALTPEIFVFKTKGLLVGASSYERLQRNRFRLTFQNDKIEGILDGGHNALAIGTHILMRAVGESIKRKCKTWSEFKGVWDEYREDIEALRKLKPGEDDEYEENALDFLVPVEVLVPADLEDEDTVAEFNSSLLAICSARNNNAELTVETKANKKGLYENLRKALPQEIADRVEWKTNDGGDIKVRDIVALSWIPLGALPQEYIPDVAPQNIYRNKGECSKLYDLLMMDDRVTQPTEGDYTRELHNDSVKSAIEITAELPALYDKIYLAFPGAYNDVDGGRFGKITVVKMAKDMKSKPKTYFTGQPVTYNYPDGLMMPIVYGLQALMDVDEDDCVRWSQNPYQFLEQHLVAIMRKYRVLLDAYHFDPQKVGKSEGCYQLVLDAFKHELMFSKM